MALTAAQDVPLNVRSDNSLSERRISPAWTLAQFKTRLEPITGIPSSSQQLALKLGGSQEGIALEASNEETTQLSDWPLQPYAEIYVTDTRPKHLRPSYTISDSSAPQVEKYTMPTQTYENLPSSVLAYKRANGLGRFNPSLPSAEAQAHARSVREADERHISVGKRCRLVSGGASTSATTANADHDDLRGTVRYLGDIPELPGAGVWVGVALDEPTGRNDGTVRGGKRYFECGSSCGVFVTPERVEIGDFAVLDDLDEDMEEI